MTTSPVPILDHPTADEAVFRPENLLARAAAMSGRQRSTIPRCCLLDFDGELVPVAEERFGAKPSPAWPCFHTKLMIVEDGGVEMGLIGGTVGAPFAVLVAEQLIASGCRHVIGYSSAGAVATDLLLPCLVVPDRALRDEGTSYHYLPPRPWAEARGRLPGVLARLAGDCGLRVHRGSTWTTDAPYRETNTQITRHRASGILTVEMEAAALMTLAQVRAVEIASLLHVTNSFATAENDFHKGPADINEKVILCCLNTFSEVLGEGGGRGAEGSHEGA
ncbi:MAG: nucleoside phosphorylase [Kiritimatiellaeota bacterium]|nr:nucleoside phosphorylase [Kiritimatiellota bacterium]